MEGKLPAAIEVRKKKKLRESEREIAYPDWSGVEWSGLKKTLLLIFHNLCLVSYSRCAIEELKWVGIEDVAWSGMRGVCSWRRGVLSVLRLR
jgi:hypothetical protein